MGQRDDYIKKAAELLERASQVSGEEQLKQLFIAEEWIKLAVTETTVPPKSNYWAVTTVRNIALLIVWLVAVSGSATFLIMLMVVSDRDGLLFLAGVVAGTIITGLTIYGLTLDVADEPDPVE